MLLQCVEFVNKLSIKLSVIVENLYDLSSEISTESLDFHFSFGGTQKSRLDVGGAAAVKR